MEKVVLDFEGILDSSLIKTNKSTASSIVVNQISTVYVEGLFKDYSLTIEDYLKSDLWQSIKFKGLPTAWLLRLIIPSSGEVATEVGPSFVTSVDVRSAKKAKKPITKVGFKFMSLITEKQNVVGMLVSQKVRVQVVQFVEPPKVEKAKE
jgi:hypothetical protein